jgi:hypothetical protein
MSQTTKTTRYNGLITYVLRQLKTTQNKIFLHYIQDLHVSYQEGTLPKYTPWKSVLDVEDKIRVLRHAEVWDSTKSKDTLAMALNATSALTDQLKEFLANQISTESKHLVTTPKPNTLSREGRDGKDGRQHGRSNPEWVYTPPQNLADTKTVQNRTYYGVPSVIVAMVSGYSHTTMKPTRTIIYIPTNATMELNPLLHSRPLTLHNYKPKQHPQMTLEINPRVRCRCRTR